MMFKLRRISLLILTACVIAVAIPFSTVVHAQENNTERKDVTVFIRVDDVFMLSSELLPQEIKYFLNVAEKHDAGVMLAVIPRRLKQITNQQQQMERSLKEAVNDGHQIVQHGYDHRNTFTQSTNWEYYEPDAKVHSEEMMIKQVRHGKQLMEQIIGETVTSYVGPGYDNDYVLSEDEDIYRNIGFTWLTDQNAKEPYLEGSKAYFFSLSDYAWALTEENYEEKLNEAKQAFDKAIQTSDYWGMLFHDHFTRRAYNNGITLRWFDEILTWLSDHPKADVNFMTVDGWYKQQSGR